MGDELITKESKKEERRKKKKEKKRRIKDRWRFYVLFICFMCMQKHNGISYQKRKKHNGIRMSEILNTYIIWFL